VAAHSTVRSLFSAYAGKLYQVRRSSDSKTQDITALSAGGAADAASQDAFCTGTTCVITKVYDQTGKGNDLQYQGTGGSLGKDYPSTATKESFQLGGHKVYSLWIDGTQTTSAAGSTTNQPNSYWVDGSKTGVPTGSAPEGVYMVTSGTHYNSGCCFDYGNSETTRTADGAGAMDAIYFGSSCWFKSTSTYVCNTGSGPWIQADLEYGLFASNSSTTWNANDISFTNKYVTAILKNGGTNTFALKGGNAQSGSLTTLWDGKSPYSIMKKQGAIILGSGGDCCYTNNNQNMSAGTFYEGAIVSGVPSNATDDAVQANIVAAGYGSSTTAIAPSLRRTGSASFSFDPSTSTGRLDFELASPARTVALELIDPQGRHLASIVRSDLGTGSQALMLDSKALSGGVRFARLVVDGWTAWSGAMVATR
jgi:hypothetical protein